MLMHANHSITHSPPEDWTCWSEAASEAAGASLIATTGAVRAMDLFLLDPGNEGTLGHRRWLLSGSLGPVGVGSTTEFSCVWYQGGAGTAEPAWTAWPPPGEVPHDVLGQGTLDWTGWSVQSDTLDLHDRAVRVWQDDVEVPVVVTTLSDGDGSATALSFRPDGWTAQVGPTYRVELQGTDIAYELWFVDCGASGSLTP